jgi:hypothetical protein
MATPTWTSVELPILEAINAAATPAGGPRWEAVVQATGLPPGKVQLSLRRLYDAGRIAGEDVSSNAGGFELIKIRLLEPGLRDVKVWPDDPFEQLVSVL